MVDDRNQFLVGDWLVDPEADRITSGPVSKTLRHQVMEVLVYLAKHQGRVVSADNLLDDLWAGKVVTSGNVYNVIAELRQQLAGANGDIVEYIETIPKKGYRLVADVSGVVDEREPAARSAETSGGVIEQLRRRNVTRVGLAYLAVSWFILQVLETLTSLGIFQESFGRYAFFALLIGFPVALLLSWKYEYTADGLQSASDVGVLVRTAPFGGRRIDLLIIGSLSLVIVLLVLDNYVLDKAPGADRISVAVLPFANLSDDPNQEHFVDGLTEELLNSLAAIEQLRVISRTSSFVFKDRNQPIAEIAAALGVGNILEGSVRRAGERIRITAQLIDTNTDAHLWSSTFDRVLNVDNVLEIQEEIANQVAAALQVNLMPQSETRKADRPGNLVALDHYHDGLYYVNDLDLEDDQPGNAAEKAIEKFQAAIAADPSWAAPHVDLARVYLFTKHWGDPITRLDTARGHIMDALQLDDSYGPAHAALGYLLTIDGDYQGAMRAYNRSRALGHNVHWTMAMLFRILSRNAESIAEFHEAAAIEPMVPQFKFQLYETYYCAGRYAEAISGLAEFFSGDDAFIYSNIVLAKSYAGSGDFDSALQLADKVAEEIGEEAPLAEVYVLAGQVERARRALDATDMMGEPFVITDMAPAVALLGNQDRALDMLERAADMVLPDVVLRYDWLWRWRCAPAIQGLSGNPRYEALLERLGLPE